MDAFSTGIRKEQVAASVLWDGEDKGEGKATDIVAGCWVQPQKSASEGVLGHPLRTQQPSRWRCGKSI